MRMSECLRLAVDSYLDQASSASGPDHSHLVGGGAVAQLEGKLERFYGVRHALCVSSATMGLLAVAQALDLKGERFITTPYTYGASLAGWLLLGNRPVFADVDAETLTLDSGAVESAMRKDVRAILAVDIFGVPSDTKNLRRIADEHGAWYVADAAQSLGAWRDGLPASRLADAIVVSFTVGKPLDAREGGAILTDHDWLYERLLWFTQHPARHVRELGVGLANEFALNARIHPLAAVWAEAVFDDALESVAVHREQCFELIEALNATGLTEPLHFLERRIAPTFFRLSVARKPGTRRKHLGRVLSRSAPSAWLAPPPVRLLYRQGAFLAQYSGIWETPGCPVAEDQARRRVCVVNT